DFERGGMNMTRSPHAMRKRKAYERCRMGDKISRHRMTNVQSTYPLRLGVPKIPKLSLLTRDQCPPELTEIDLLPFAIQDGLWVANRSPRFFRMETVRKF